MSHEAYVFAAYAVSALTIGALIAWILLDQRARRRDLAALEKAGIRRRSEEKA